MKQKLYEDEIYTILAENITKGVKLNVFYTISLKTRFSFKVNTFSTYIITQPNWIMKMFGDSYRKRINKARKALIKEITKEKYDLEKYLKTREEILEETKRILKTYES